MVQKNNQENETELIKWEKCEECRKLDDEYADYCPWCGVKQSNEYDEYLNKENQNESINL